MQYECAENESRTTAAEPIKPMQYADVGLPMEIDKTHLAPEAPVPTQHLPETNRSWLLVHHYYTFIPYIVITSYLVRYFVYRCFLVLLALRLVTPFFQRRLLSTLRVLCIAFPAKKTKISQGIASGEIKVSAN